MASFSGARLFLAHFELPLSARVCAQCLRQAPHLRPKTFPLPRFQQRRFLSLTRPLFRPAPPRIGKPRAKLPEPVEYSASYAQTLNRTLTKPTVIYEAPSHTALVLAASGMTIFFFAYGIGGGLKPGIEMLYGEPIKELAWIIPPSMIFAGFALLGIGVWMYGSVCMLVKRITAIPHGKKGELLAKLEVTRWAPWWRTEMTVPFKSLRLARSVQGAAPRDPLDKDRIADANIFVRFFLLGGSWMRAFFEETKNVFMREPFVTLAVVKHGKLKLDARGSAFKGAEGLDMLIPRDSSKAKFWETSRT